MKLWSRVLLVAVSMVLMGACVQAQVDEKVFSDMKWREIGPMRAGRTRVRWRACRASRRRSTWAR